ncbi:unnamed protein product [Periconia digitata]|uniref:Uncharacterized protein n=1 Tax=Periconia digitata TaxID=1303443 RepID=A0A9W4UVE1_9PLEO|nr:unnamed protein product [Periconia digitata]
MTQCPSSLVMLNGKGMISNPSSRFPLTFIFKSSTTNPILECDLENSRHRGFNIEGRNLDEWSKHCQSERWRGPRYVSFMPCDYIHLVHITIDQITLRQPAKKGDPSRTMTRWQTATSSIKL